MGCFGTGDAFPKFKETNAENTLWKVHFHHVSLTAWIGLIFEPPLGMNVSYCSHLPKRGLGLCPGLRFALARSCQVVPVSVLQWGSFFPSTCEDRS